VLYKEADKTCTYLAICRTGTQIQYGPKRHHNFNLDKRSMLNWWTMKLLWIYDQINVERRFSNSLFNILPNKDVPYRSSIIFSRSFGRFRWPIEIIDGCLDIVTRGTLSNGTGNTREVPNSMKLEYLKLGSPVSFQTDQYTWRQLILVLLSVLSSMSL